MSSLIFLQETKRIALLMHLGVEVTKLITLAREMEQARITTGVLGKWSGN